MKNRKGHPVLVKTENLSFVRFEIPSDHSYAYQVLLHSERFLSRHGISEHSSFNVVLRELLLNAIVHGNRGETERTVRCEVVHVGEGRFRIVVEDEGEGFDYRALDTLLPADPKRIRHRGYKLVNALSDQLEFNREGNQVTAYVCVA